MKYFKIKVMYCMDTERFYRTFLVNPNMKLADFGCAILTTMCSTIEQDYFFSKSVIRYLPKNMIRKYYEKEDKFIGDYMVKDIVDEFNFHYGVDEYQFYCEVVSLVEADEAQDIYLVEGLGQGIWEGTVNTLNSYLRGDLDPEELEVDYFFDIYPPKNVKITKYGDFDTAFNLELMQELFIEIYKIKLFKLENYK